MAMAVNALADRLSDKVLLIGRSWPVIDSTPPVQ